MINTTLTHTNSTHSPYECAKIINNKIKEIGIEKVLPPQMFYTYIKKAYIISEINESGKRVVTTHELEVWFTKYITRYNEIQTRKAIEASMISE